MSTIKIKQLAFLEDTVKFYSENPDKRAMTEYGCKYRTEDGRACAIGRHLPETLAHKLDLFGQDTSVRKVFEELPGELKELGVDFLQNVQNLHDSDESWSSKGLTSSGNTRLNRIKAKFSLDETNV